MSGIIAINDLRADASKSLGSTLAKGLIMPF
jgi:hypothetical protein